MIVVVLLVVVWPFLLVLPVVPAVIPGVMRCFLVIPLPIVVGILLVLVLPHSAVFVPGVLCNESL